MLVGADVKSLEIYTAAFLSQDKVMMKELIDGVDMHERNRADFDLPTRLIAKVLGFRILYGGSAYSFINDPDFMVVSKNQAYWQNAIDKYYAKYQGLQDWHNRIQEEVIRTKQLTMPTGRVYHFDMYKTEKGDYKWPTTNIKNYPVQGTGSDLVAIYRVSLYNRIKKAGLSSKLLATVHDSVLLDSPDDEVSTVVEMLHSVANDVPKNFQKLFGVEYNLPFLVECEVGNNYLNME
jgi:DNA polymerase-1